MKFVNVYAEHACYLWAFIEGYDPDYDDDDQECTFNEPLTIDIGEKPQWLEELHEFGWEGVFDICDDYIEWANSNGVKPGHPFFVKLFPPQYSQGYDGEWDLDDFPYEIVKVLDKTFDEIEKENQPDEIDEWRLLKQNNYV